MSVVLSEGGEIAWISFRLDEVEDGAAVGFDPFSCGSDTHFGVRRGDRFHAYLDRCPHVGDVALPWRKDAYLTGDRSAIRCANHGACFDIETGICFQGPCLGDRLAAVPTNCGTDGTVTVTARRSEVIGRV